VHVARRDAGNNLPPKEPVMRKPILSESHEEQLTALLIGVLEAHKTGEFSTRVASSGIMQVIASIDAGETGEMEAWLGQRDLKFFRVDV
jgi:hypothetical protein